MHRQKVAEVEKLTQTVREIEEAVLSGGAAANAVRDYQRKVQEMNVIIVIIEILFNCSVALSLLYTPFVLFFFDKKLLSFLNISAIKNYLTL